MADRDGCPRGACALAYIALALEVERERVWNGSFDSARRGFTMGGNGGAVWLVGESRASQSCTAAGSQESEMKVEMREPAREPAIAVAAVSY